MALVFCQLTAETGVQADTDINHLSLDGKALRGSKDADGKAEHVRSAFCVAMDQSVGPVSSHGKGMGKKTVAVFAEEDKLGLHRFKAGEAYRIGQGLGPVAA